MNRALPVRWLRSLARALQRWLGSGRAGREAWECHRGTLAPDVEFRLLLPPTPSGQDAIAPGQWNAVVCPAPTAAVSPPAAAGSGGHNRAPSRLEAAATMVRDCQEIPRRRMVSGVCFAPLALRARQGAIIVAHLEDGSATRRPALLRVAARG